MDPDLAETTLAAGPEPSAPAGVQISARGTKLTRRGLETRARVIQVAIGLLASGDSSAVSGNLVAKSAGVTWGTVQHQFGDVDGLWAAVLEELGRKRQMLPVVTLDGDDVLARVEQIVNSLWAAYNNDEARAVATLRETLPKGAAELAEAYPLTTEQIDVWDRNWRQAYARAFRGLVVDAYRLERIRNLLPAAVRGLYEEQTLSTWTDIEEARNGLIQSTALYLATHEEVAPTSQLH